MTSVATHPTPSFTSRLWNRELTSYPSTPARYTSLAIVVLTTVVLYYQLYLAGAIATQILRDLDMSFVYYVNISVVGYVLGAAASVIAGIADRYGRANIVTVGLLLTGLLCLFGIPNVHSKLAFGVVFVAIGFVEGIILVATPALVRDFSPQLGRASAMGFWTLGPVVGSLVVSVVTSTTLDHLPRWQTQYVICGVVGLVVFLIALVGLRELAPSLRDQLMVSSRDRVLIEARAKGVDIAAALKHPFKQMWRLDIIGSAFAISVFLIIYYVAVGFFPIYFQTIFGYTPSQANALGNWVWAFDAGALILTGVLSDRLRVRKPFMVVGALGAIVMTVIFALSATRPGTSYNTFVVILVLLAAFLGVAYAPWMASFTETVERHNPALTATGLAVWGLVIRLVIAVSVFIVPLVVTTVTTLVEKGPTAQALAVKYQTQLATASKVAPATLAALSANPQDLTAQVTALSQISGKSAADVTKVVTLSTQYADQLKTAAAVDPATLATLATNPTDATAGASAVGQIVTKLGVTPGEAVTKLQALATVPVADLLFLQGNGTAVQSAAAQLTALAAVPPADTALLQEVQKAAADSPGQWQNYYWIAVGGEIVFLPLIFVMAGYWSPRKAREEAERHQTYLDAELAKLSETQPV